MFSKYLVLGAGELGMAVVRGLARRAASEPAGTVAVLLRPGSVASADPAKLRIVAELEFLGVRTVTGDLTAGSDGDLSALFEGFHTVVSCTGFVGGPGFQRRLTRAILAVRGQSVTSRGSSASITTRSAGAARRICGTSNWTSVT